MLFEFRWETFLNAPTICMMQTSGARKAPPPVAFHDRRRRRRKEILANLRFNCR
ncbi:unnamed protein product [Ciceribacter selenitireducens ATCC BAA-1503]|uniref:Uncharacterized protein n=1 Tax=Ciceribacter selenitireducens ATCC BAA-1503 TaxID=1336235 RepID=A0A376AFZ1_9HYPH|nr:unnamed protein product [Ciceribacter selenitireducens ATCC BAA-1503]